MSGEKGMYDVSPDDFHEGSSDMSDAVTHGHASFKGAENGKRSNRCSGNDMNGRSSRKVHDPKFLGPAFYIP